MLDVIFLPAAQYDYQEALSWYQDRSEAAAAGFEQAIEAATNAIRTSPEQWAKYDRDHREYIVDRRYPFSLIYRFDDTQVVVVAVRHASRRPGFWRKRGK